MKRFFLSVLALGWMCLAGAVSYSDLPYHIDTIQQFPAGPGAEFFQLSMNPNKGSGHLDGWLLVVDTRNPYVSIEQVLGKDAVIGTERPSSMAIRKTTDTKIFYGGANGDFFATTGDVGRPTGLTIVNNEFAYTPKGDTRRLGAVDADGRGHIASSKQTAFSLLLPDTTLTISHINYTRDANELVLYNRHNGATTLTNSYGTELGLELLPGQVWKTNATLRMRVTSKEDGVGNMTIVPGQAVLSAHGTMADQLAGVAIGDTVTIGLSLLLDNVVADIAQCIAGDNYALILEDGRVVESNFWNELHPRTAFGQSITGDTLFFLVVDGRGSSIGCTTQLLGRILAYYGAYRAVNWDGGGSSCLYVRPFGETNHGSDGSERAVGNAMFAVANVPSADTVITMIAPYRHAYSIPRYGVLQPRFLGYNQYGVLVSTNVSGIRLSAPAEVGSVMDDGRFLASGQQGGVLTASYGTASTELEIRIIPSASAKIRLDTAMIDVYKPYTPELTCFIAGDTLSLLPSALTWSSSDENVCTVGADGLITAHNDGEAMVIGTLGELSDTLIVKVQNPTSHVLLWDDMLTTIDDWKLKASSGYNPTLVAEGVAGMTDSAQQAVLHYTYSVARGAYLNMYRSQPFYGLPDSISLGMILDNTVVSRLSINATPANSDMPVSYKSDNLPVNQEYWCTFAVSEVADVSDRAIYPLRSGNINFLLDTSTPLGEHAIRFLGIRLIYNGVEDTTPVVNLSQDAEIVKYVENGQVIIRRGENRYTIMGEKL